jgi:hypothetical protein
VAISNEQLRFAFLSPEMRCYFGKKFPAVPAGELDIRIEEALKFLNIADHCSGSIPVTTEIDDIWHFWILETREYMKLCSRLQGREYIHHVSNAYAQCLASSEPLVQNTIAQDIGVLATYVLNYGPFEEDRVKYWLLATHLTEQCGMTVRDLNEWLISR